MKKDIIQYEINKLFLIGYYNKIIHRDSRFTYSLDMDYESIIITENLTLTLKLYAKDKDYILHCHHIDKLIYGELIKTENSFKKERMKKISINECKLIIDFIINNNYKKRNLYNYTIEGRNSNVEVLKIVKRELKKVDLLAIAQRYALEYL